MSNSKHLHSSNNLSAQELLSRQKSGEHIMLLDVREPIEFHTFNIGGTNIPLARLQESISALELNKDQEIIVLCKIGLRSKTAQTILGQMGFTQVKNLDGGLMAVQRITN